MCPIPGLGVIAWVKLWVGISSGWLDGWRPNAGCTANLGTKNKHNCWQTLIITNTSKYRANIFLKALHCNNLWFKGVHYGKV